MYNNCGMNRKIKLLILVFAVALSIIIYQQKYILDKQSCITDSVADKMSLLIAERYEHIKGLDLEGINMELAYQLAKRSVTGIEIDNSVGNGIIWRIQEDKVVVVTNRHLLDNGIKAQVFFCDGSSAAAKILGCSQQYDIGFLEIDIRDISKNAIREIYEAVPVMYNLEDDYEMDLFNNQMTGLDIIQLGMDLVYKGKISKVSFVPVFNTHVIESECYSKAGMSGGGMFDVEGRFIGMISGGDVLEDSEYREADITYSIPAWLIENELELMMKG